MRKNGIFWGKWDFLGKTEKKTGRKKLKKKRTLFSFVFFRKSAPSDVEHGTGRGYYGPSRWCSRCGCMGPLLGLPDRKGPGQCILQDVEHGTGRGYYGPSRWCSRCGCMGPLLGLPDRKGPGAVHPPGCGTRHRARILWSQPVV